MPDYTKNKKLYKPNRKDEIEVDTSLAKNFDVIDQEFKNIEDEIKNTNDAMNQLVIEGDSSVEAAQARLSETGQIYPTLKQRLDSENQELAVKLAETESSIINVASSNVLNSNPQIIYAAHRGAEGLAPENTLKAFELSAIHGFEFIELDIQFTSDNVPIVMHDETVDRTTNGTGLVSSMTLAQIKALVIDGGNFPAWYKNMKVPTLEETLLLCRKLKLNPIIEVKTYGAEDNLSKLINLLVSMGFEHSASVFGHWSLAQKIKTINKNINTGIFYVNEPTFVATAKALKPNVFVGMDVSILTKSLVDKFHVEGIKVGTYTVTPAMDKQAIINTNVDYIIGGVIGD